MPRSSRDKLLLATWNIANLGVQKRSEEAKSLIAYILKRFDLIAVQEINEKYHTLAEIVSNMGSGYDFIMNDKIAAARDRAYLRKVERVTAIGKYEVVFKFKEPYFNSLQLAGGMHDCGFPRVSHISRTIFQR